MSEFDIEPSQWINAAHRNIPSRSKMEPKIDELVSQAVGFRVFMNDPRLIKLIVGWKAGKDPSSNEPDNYLQDPEKVKILKETLSKPL